MNRTKTTKSISMNLIDLSKELTDADELLMTLREDPETYTHSSGPIKQVRTSYLEIRDELERLMGKPDGVDFGTSRIETLQELVGYSIKRLVETYGPLPQENPKPKDQNY